MVITPNGTFHPILDEAGTGNLIAVLDDAGVLVERAFYGDSYGASPRFLHGPVVQRMTRKVTKNQQGEITEVVFTANLSDAVRADTVVAGTVLRSVAGDATAALSTVEPTLDIADPHTLRWTLNAAQWNALTSAAGVTAIEIAITKELRAVGWGEAEVLRPPGWLVTLVGLTSTATDSVVHRQSIAAFETATEQETTLLAISDLYLVASTESRSRILTGWKSAPFVEPATGFAFLRDRWYDASSGTFLGPDRLGYRDSSNLYAFCGGDPVNCSDPSGLGGVGEAVMMARERQRLKTPEQRRAEHRELGSLTVGFIPVAGEIHDASQAITGYDLVTGERLSWWGRGLTAGAFFVPFVGGKVVRDAAAEVVRPLRGFLNDVNPFRWFDDIGDAAARGLNEGAVEAYQHLMANRGCSSSSVIYAEC